MFVSSRSAAIVCTENDIMTRSLTAAIVLDCRPCFAGAALLLLLSQFMQRKVKADEAQRQQQEKRDKLESDFSSSYLKRLKPDKPNQKDR